jgi:Carboxypeptidase regulatory-like domain
MNLIHMKKIPITIILLLLLSVKAFAQIEGDVRSKDDKRILNAVVVALDTTMNVIDSVLSGEEGFYSFTNLKPGKYFIEAKAKGFENRLYKNVIVWEKPFDAKKGNDQSYATRLQIVLSPSKPKQ